MHASAVGHSSDVRRPRWFPVIGSVVMVTNRYAPSIGGVQTYSRRLAEALAAAGVEVEVFTHHLDPFQASVARLDSGVLIRRFTPLVRHEHGLISPSLLTALRLKRDGGATLHLHSVHDPIVAAAAAVWNGPLVLSPHFHETNDGSIRRVMHRGYRPAIRWLGRRAQVTCCSSFAEAELFADRSGLDPSRVVVIPSGIDVDRIRAAPAGAWRLKRRVVVAERLVAYKRVDRIVAAMRNLRDTHDLVVIGDGPELDRLQQFAVECGVEDSVHFIGTLSDDAFHSHLATADVVCSASTLESLNIVALEGITAGAAVLLSDIAAHREIHETYGDRSALFGPDESPRGIARAIRSLSIVRTVALAPDRLPADWTSVAQRFLAVYGWATEVHNAGVAGRHLGEHLESA